MITREHQLGLTKHWKWSLKKFSKLQMEIDQNLQIS